MKEETHIFQGMRRDNHQIRQDGKFLWDAHNIRLTNRDDSTFLSITNEKGTSNSLITFEGYYVGHCVLGKYLVVFTANDDSSDNYIYRVEKTNLGYTSTVLFHEADVWDHGWNPNHPIEAIGIYENEQVQKVYWIDGINQPRVINIVKENANYSTNSFDFVQSLQLHEQVGVFKLYGEGIFSPGTIQYALTYYNKYGQESNIFYTTPLNYVSPSDRGGNPEERIANSFRIEVDGVDTNFEYLRIYSIHRTSIDAVPTVKRVIDLPIDKAKMEEEGDWSMYYIDTGTVGETVDPTLLLYIGGRNIVASSMCTKDGTLFLGGIELRDNLEWLEIKDKVQNEIGPEEWDPVMIKFDTQNPGNGEYYSYNINLGNAGFKTDETYRCGIQLQSETGVWSEPIFLKDEILNEKYPYSGTASSIWNSYRVRLWSGLVDYLRKKGYVRVRTCIVFPSMIDRTIICQGVLCPTVFNVGARSSNSPYAMASWFFRPQVDSAQINNNENVYKGSTIQYIHNRPLYTGPNRGAEIQCTPDNSAITKVGDITSAITQSSYFFVDANLVTMHSPEIEFDPSIQNLVLDDSLELKVLGDVQLGASIGDIDIQTSSPAIYAEAPGFTHKLIGYQIGDTKSSGINGGLVAGAFYQDALAKEDGTRVGLSVHHLIYPWHRSGSLNNSSRVNEKTRSAVLSKKKISNLKFFNRFVKSENDITYNIGTPQLFSSNEMSIVKVWVDYLGKSVPYYGNVDTIITAPSDGYSLYTAASFSGTFGAIPEGNSVILKSSDPVRMKYKSTPHLVFSLKSSSAKGIEILPTKEGYGINGEEYKIPDWDNTTGAEDNDPGTEEDYLELTRIYGSSKYSFTEALAREVGKFAWRRIYGNLGTKKLFAKALYEGTGPSKTGWNYNAAKLELKEGTIFKVVGDGKSCMIEGSLTDLGLGEGSYRHYSGPTKYFKLTNLYYPTESSLNLSVGGDLVEIQTPAKVAESRAASQGDTFTLTQKYLNTNKEDRFEPFLVLAELRRKNVTNRFGGSSDSAKRANIWLPAGDPVRLTETDDEGAVGVEFRYGDTWYSRYDCLKTYPFTQEDENSIIEIGSFMCETRVNIDGRYDRNRGQISNLNITPQNFNLLNEVYTQKDNFFNYRIFEDDYYKGNKFLNQITWSLEKTPASDTDPWTNITLANTLDMDGEKGKVTALRTWNEYLLCFQEKALSQILFNSRVQIPTTDGVPIEISNGYKVDGSRLLSGNIGCSNKWATTTTTTGIYFLDSNTDSLYIFNGQLANLSEDRGMDWWVRQNHTSRLWQPILYGNNVLNGIRAFYDNKYGDIYFTPGPTDNAVQPEALCYSEQLGQFTSFMSYGGTQAMFNFADGFYSLRETDGNVKLYENNAGYHNNFYGTPKGWSFSFISNQDPTFTKIFDTIDLRTDHYWTYGTTGLLNTCPVSYIQADNEYQHSGTVAIDSRNMRKKFRVWRGLIPRNGGTRQRMRNPWTMITLGWEPVKATPDTAVMIGTNNKKAVVHDVTVKYTV